MKGLVLISDGIDSPVAAHLMLKKGFDIDAVHFSMDGKEQIKTITDILKTIGKEYSREIKLYIVDHIPNQESFRKNCIRRYQCILCKRIMHKIAERVGLENGYDFLVNGENLGQVASQTLSNMRNIHEGLKIKVYQPLLCYDKQETIDIAKKIGTYELSIKNNRKCPYLPEKPATVSRPEKVAAEEAKVGMESLVSKACENIRIIKIQTA